MMNIMAGIVNSMHYIEQIADAKAVKSEKNFEEDYKKRVDQVRRVGKVKAINNLSNPNQHAQAQEFFRTEMVADDKGKSTMLILTSNQGFRQINLEGTMKQEDEKLINPAKVKAAYFND